MRMLGALAAVLIVACKGGGDEPLRRADGSLLSSSGGEVALADGNRVQVAITSERYKKWEAARKALRKNVTARFGELLRPKSPTEKSIDRAVAFLDADVDAKESIERSGMSVRDFVLMTVALEQEMQAATRRPEPRASATQVSFPASPDTLFRFDSSRFVRDSVWATRRDSADLARRDAVELARRDSVDLARRDSIELARRESADLARRDSLAQMKRDSLMQSRLDFLQRKRNDAPRPRSDTLPTPRDTVRWLIAPRDTARDTAVVGDSTAIPRQSPPRV